MKKPNNEQSLKNPAHIHLIGDEEEIFYQLGVKDRHVGKKLHRDVRSLLKSNSKIVDQFIQAGAEEYLKRTTFKDPKKYPRLLSYSEGIQESFFELAYTLTVPELVSSISHWLPKFSPRPSFNPLGCSSFFHLNDKNELIHHRILDFPLQGTYDVEERSMLFELKNSPKIFGFGTIGMPYPSITLTTSHGLSLALHQKFTNQFFKNGTPIFEIIFDLAKNVATIEDAISFLKTQHSLTTWCLNMGFKDHQVLSIDLSGDKIEYERHHLEDKKILYYCNKIIDKNFNQLSQIPYGFNSYNEMRENSAQEKINFLTNAKSTLTETDVLKVITTPKHLISKKKYQNFELDVITPSSLQISTFNLNSSEVYFLSGTAPKIFNNNFIKFTNIFRNVEKQLFQMKIKKNEVDLNFNEGLKELMNAQKTLDHHKISETYHHLQMSIDFFKQSKDPNYKDIVYFYFLILQFLHDNHQKVRQQIREELHLLKDKLPLHLEDHRLLFIARLNYLLDGSFLIEEDTITHHVLKNALNIENRIPRALYWRVIKNFVTLRFDILDIIYLHLLP